MGVVAVERHGVLNFTRHGPDRHLDAEPRSRSVNSA